MKPKLIPYNKDIFIDYHDGMALICREHMMKVDELEQPNDFMGRATELDYVRCLEGPHRIHLDRKPSVIRELLSRRINSKKYQEAEYFDIDGYLVPASKEVQKKTKSGDYSITAQVKRSEKRGEQIVIYVAKKGLEGKSQIFVDPTYGKLTFDQHDVSPRDLFVKIEATFRGGSKAAISDGEHNETS